MATKPGGINYRPITIEKTITIDKSPQDDMEFETGILFTYTPSLVIDLSATGGSGDGSIQYEVSNNGITTTNIFSIVEPNVGDYLVTATKSGGLNYNDKIISQLIRVNPGIVSPLTFNNLTSYSYDPNQTILIDVSGGGTGEPIIIEVQYNDGPFEEKSELVNPTAGKYTIIVSQAGGGNYADISSSFIITVNKINQQPLTVTPSTVKYELQAGTVQLNISGGSSTGDLQVISPTGDFDIKENNVIDYSRPGTVQIQVIKKGDQNYFPVQTTLIFSVVKDISYLKREKYRPRTLVNDPYITFNDLFGVYNVRELMDNNINGVLEADTKNGFSLREMRTIGVSACAIYDTKEITLRDLIRAGYKINICHRP